MIEVYALFFLSQPCGYSNHAATGTFDVASEWRGWRDNIRADDVAGGNLFVASNLHRRLAIFWTANIRR